jgi:hypothetical protein
MSGWLRWRAAEQPRTDECPVVGMRLLQTYLDGETDPATTRFLFVHVEECRGCREDLSSYWKIRNSPLHCERPDEAAVERLRAFAESLLHSSEGAPVDAVPETGA